MRTNARSALTLRGKLRPTAAELHATCRFAMNLPAPFEDALAPTATLERQPLTDHPGLREALVAAVSPVSEGVLSIALQPAAPTPGFPAFDAGAHIDLHLPGGMVRSYSLHNPPGQKDRYVIGVLHERAGRGGSRWIHENLRAGDRLMISAPRNHFALDEQAQRSVFVAGGIGVTPVLSMLQRLVALGKPGHLIYCARSRASAPFLDLLATLTPHGISVQTHFDDEAGSPPDLQTLLSRHLSTDHFYCCGPGPMLQAFESSCETLGFGNVHVERFKAQAQPLAAAVDGFCSVELRRSGLTLEIAKNTPPLGALLAAGIAVEYSCEEGVCGACETPILQGEADHRDSLLSAAQKAGQQCMMVCVSRCRSDRMVLDL